jgi:5-formyltetrahydrofolate cyclo-ligase
LEAHPQVKSAQGVALFWPIVERGEVDLRALDFVLRARGVRVYYPVMEPSARGFSTGFRLSEDVAELDERGGTFAAPPPSAPMAARGDIDVVIVPALAADVRGHRVGYGKGYYDATLPDVCPPASSILVVFDFQLEGELPSEDHDQPVDFVVTEKRSLTVAQS